MGDAGPTTAAGPRGNDDDWTRQQRQRTRPISVAELLAKNGTIGSPPVGGRPPASTRQHDAVTVAELTGEIPIITDDYEPEPARRDEPVPAPDLVWSF